MKKLLLLTVFFGAVASASVNAQTASGPSATATVAPQQAKQPDAATTLRQTQEKVAPLMVEKTGLTAAQANKVIEILFEMRQGASAVQNLSEDERTAKLTELKATKDKKMSELLSPEQIAAVKRFYQEMGSGAPPKN